MDDVAGLLSVLSGKWYIGQNVQTNTKAIKKADIVRNVVGTDFIRFVALGQWDGRIDKIDPSRPDCLLVSHSFGCPSTEDYAPDSFVAWFYPKDVTEDKDG